jgi:phospholipase/carboxylesterase
MTQQTTLLSSIEIQPEGQAERSVIWLHGLGADGSDFVPIVQELQLPKQLGIRFIFPHAPVIPITINNGYAMRAWYNILSINLERIIDHLGIQQSISQVNALIQQEIERGIKLNNILLAGFSQGAVVALATALTHAKPLAGVIALSGYLSSPNILGQNKQLPIFLAHGTEDPVVPYALGEAAHAALSEAGYPIDWHSYPMAHSVCPQEIQDLRKWIEGVWE